MMSDKPEVPPRRIFWGLLCAVFFGFLFPLISPWHILTLTQVLGCVFTFFFVGWFCAAAYENYGLLAAVATFGLTNVLVVVGWTGFRLLVTNFLPKSSTSKSRQTGDDN